MMLEISGLSLFYGDMQALDGVSLAAPERSITAIVGGNGAGKTSLIRAVAGIERPRAGRILFKGTDITGWPSHRIAALGIGQVAEGRQLFPSLTVRENLAMGALARRRGRAAAAASLERVFALFPRLAERSRQPAGTLSGGEQQMVAIARCLMGDPELIMFDEPSLGLAPIMVAEMLRVIETLARDHGILLVEQNVQASLSLAERAYVLESGRITLAGRGSELLADERVRAAYLGL